MMAGSMPRRSYRDSSYNNAGSPCHIVEVTSRNRGRAFS
jgi:hypothetical protein